MTRKKWGIQVKIALMQKGLTQSDLARELGVRRGYVNGVINDSLSTPGTGAVKKISELLGLELPDGIEKRESKK